LSGHENLSPKKIIVIDKPKAKYGNYEKENKLNICVTEDDDDILIGSYDHERFKLMVI
jgi:hypothetical protein